MNNLEKEFRAYVTLLSVVNEIEQANMIDAVSIAKSVSAIFQAMNQLNKYAQEIDDHQKRGELIRLIGELSEKVGYLNIEATKKEQEIIDKANEVKQLNKKLLKLQDSIHQGEIELFSDGVMYWNIKDIWGDDYSQPFCTACFKIDGLQMPLNPIPRSGQTADENLFICPKCKTEYNASLSKTSNLRKNFL